MKVWQYATSTEGYIVGWLIYIHGYTDIMRCVNGCQHKSE